MEIISSELKNLRSSGGGGGCEKKTGERISRWGRREKRPDAGHQCEEKRCEFKALDRFNFEQLLPTVSKHYTLRY